MEASKRTYEEIEPFCKKRPVVTEVDVKGFKKEHLKVQVTNLGKVVITGDRPLDETSGIRLHKELNIPDDCKRNDIRAKLRCRMLRGNILDIKMPKNIPPAVTSTEKQQPDQQNRHVLDGKTALKLEAFAAVAVVISVVAYLAYNFLN